MKKVLVLVLVLAVCLMGAWTVSAMNHGHTDKTAGCSYCGMSLTKFANSAVTIAYDDGSTVETCSIHCAAIDMALNIDKGPDKILVGEYNTKKKIDAEKAFWVLDDNNPGVMTTRAKWAFSTKSDAQDYIDLNCGGQGQLLGFEAAMRATYDDMYSDTRMIRKKRQMMKMKMNGGMGHK
jgi:copper chaperone NosL